MFKSGLSKIRFNRVVMKEVLNNKRFSTAQVNAVVGLNNGNLQEGVNSEVLSRLIHRDVDYFNHLTNENGADHTLQMLENIGNSVDKSTKYGREILKVKEEMMTRLAYNNRSMEEHQNVSTHISERDLNKVYQQHLKTLQSRTESAQLLVEKSSQDSQLLYQYQSTYGTTKYLLSPLIWGAIPMSAVLYNKFAIASLFGSFSPSLLLLASVYLGVRRYKWLTQGKKMGDSTLVSTLHLKGEQIEVVPHLSTQRHLIDLKDVQIQRIENDCRTEVYYLIKQNNQVRFIMPVDENSTANQKLLNWFNQNNLNRKDSYTITNVLLQGDRKLIDPERHRNLPYELDALARINLLNQRGVDVATLTTEELYQKLYTLEDSEVSQYLISEKERLGSIQSSLEANLVAIENLFSASGVNREESVKLTQYLREHFRVASLSNLKTLALDEFNQAFNLTVKSADLNTVRDNINAFFKTS